MARPERRPADRLKSFDGQQQTGGEEQEGGHPKPSKTA
jgi:hypothetical protein